MTTICPNCGQRFEGNYCSNCGQSADTHKMNLHFLWHDIQHGLFHLDKGILFTVKELFTRPGNSIREFIEGKRVKHFKPISLILVLAGIYGFLYHYFHINMLASNVEISGSGEDFVKAKKSLENINEWLSQHYAIVALLQLPIYAVGTYIAFRKSGYNFVEHLVLNAFLTAQRLILHITAFPLFYIFNGSPSLRVIAQLVDLIGFALMIWALVQFFNKKKKWRTFWLAIFSLIIFSFISFLIIAILFTRFILHPAK